MRKYSFVKLLTYTAVLGRIGYITSEIEQEFLYAVYSTTHDDFWLWLIEESHRRFIQKGCAGYCVEARGFYICLPEYFLSFPPEMVLKRFVDVMHRMFGVECIGAIHHNKTKRSYHIHLIFSDRRLLEEPIVKIAKKDLYFDEAGKRMYSQKAITDETGRIRPGCRVIPVGAEYDRQQFSTKIGEFGSPQFLRKMKQIFTDVINEYAPTSADRLQVFPQKSVYLPTKTIGKGNPKEAEIRANNAVREKWNDTVDTALSAGMSEEKIWEIKRREISHKIALAIQTNGDKPEDFIPCVEAAVEVLREHIRQIQPALLQAEAAVSVWLRRKEQVRRLLQENAYLEEEIHSFAGLMGLLSPGVLKNLQKKAEKLADNRIRIEDILREEDCLDLDSFWRLCAERERTQSIRKRRSVKEEEAVPVRKLAVGRNAEQSESASIWGRKAADERQR